MVKCKDCEYWDWDAFDGGEEFQRCLYGFYTQKNIYPVFQDDYPFDDEVDWDCKYFEKDKYIK